MADARVALGGVAVALISVMALSGCSTPGTGVLGDSPEPKGRVAPSSAGLGAEAGGGAPQAVARRVLGTWSRTDLGYAAWWSELRPLLSAGAREAYAFTDPAAVPELDLPASGEVTPGPYPGTTTVRFETTAGVFGVDLARVRGTGPWRAERIIFPDQPSLYSE